MPVLAFPGPAAPAPPPVTLELPERPGAAVEPPFVVDIGGREWVARHVSWDEGGGPVVEVHLAAGVDPAAHDELSRLVVATGRVRGTSLDADYDLLQSVLETLLVGGAR